MTDPGRREFLHVCVVGGAALVGAGIGGWALINPPAGTAPGEQVVPLAPMLRLEGLEPGKPLELAVTLSRRDGWRVRTRTQHLFIVRMGDADAPGKLRALSPICPHKGCSVQADEKAERFICPCHEAAFRTDGQYIEGPAPRGLDPLELTVAKHQGADWVFVKWQDFEIGTSERRPRTA